jgi:dimethylamine corrinoid protein
MIDFKKLAVAMGELDEETVKKLLKSVTTTEEANKAMEACQDGMNKIGNLFEEGEYFVGDLIYAGEIMTDVVEILKPLLLADEGGGAKAKVIICTVKDDLHDIGKNIVRSMLEAAGFEVFDLGIDVSAEEIIKTAKAENINIVALSGVLTLALDSMKNTIAEIRASGLKDVKVIVGGNPVTEEAAKLMGADDWAYSPQKTVKICSAWASAQA